MGESLVVLARVLQLAKVFARVKGLRVDFFEGSLAVRRARGDTSSSTWSLSDNEVSSVSSTESSSTSGMDEASRSGTVLMKFSKDAAVVFLLGGGVLDLTWIDTSPSLEL